MNAFDFLRIAPFINDCPNCGSEYVGNGQGTLTVNNNIVERTCKCGFNFKYDIANGTTKTKIKNAIDEVLKDMI
jgi:transcription elongation factor Elf1